jgi:hypothetical protein
MAGALAIGALTAPQQEFGDGREYVLQTQSIMFDRTLTIDVATRREYWNRRNPFGVLLEVPSPDSLDENPHDAKFGRCAQSFRSLYHAHGGGCRFVHPWAYPIAAAPVYAAMHTLFPGAGENLAFRLSNLVALFVPLVMLWAVSPTWVSGQIDRVESSPTGLVRVAR